MLKNKNISLFIVIIIIAFTSSCLYSDYFFGCELIPYNSAMDSVLFNSLVFGLDPLASVGLDMGMDILAPPTAPDAPFYWYFVSDSIHGANLTVDIRGNRIENVLWKIQVLYFTEEACITWSPDSVSAYEFESEFLIGKHYPPDLPTEWLDMESNSFISFMPGQMVYIKHTSTGIDFENKQKPILSIGNPYPNPFNSSTEIKYSLNNKAVIRIEIFDINGRELFMTQVCNTEGEHVFIWDGKTNNGMELPGGLYFVKLTAANKRAIKKLMFLK
ncbi:T9SS type A sorting domain-containing protein [bacterium]|nr:T9SS type A sorting domain-containing protein [bacterium]